MPESQKRNIAPPNEEMGDFAEVINDNVQDLYEIAHQHLPRTTAPTDAEGSIGDVIGVVIDGTTFKLYYKFSSGWKSVTLT